MFTEQQLDELRKQYATIEGIDPCEPSYDKICTILDSMDDPTLVQVANARIKFMSLLARNRCSRRKLSLEAA